MPTVETKIWLALKARIESMTPAELGMTYMDFPGGPSLVLDFAGDSYAEGAVKVPIAWPAQTFTAPHSGGGLAPYIRVGSVTVDPVSMFVATGKRHQRTGTLILTLVHPLTPNAEVAFYNEIAGKVAEHFSDGTQMRYNNVCVTVTAAPHVVPGYEDNGYWTVPVSIPWRTFA